MDVDVYRCKYCGQEQAAAAGFTPLLYCCDKSKTDIHALELISQAAPETSAPPAPEHFPMECEECGEWECVCERDPAPTQAEAMEMGAMLDAAEEIDKAVAEPVPDFDDAQVGVAFVNRMRAAETKISGKVAYLQWKIGRALLQLRKLTPHGQWLKFLEEHFDFTDQTARNYMEIAMNCEQQEAETLPIADLYRKVGIMPEPGQKRRKSILQELEAWNDRSDNMRKELRAYAEGARAMLRKVEEFAPDSVARFRDGVITSAAYLAEGFQQVAREFHNVSDEQTQPKVPYPGEGVESQTADGKSQTVLDLNSKEWREVEDYYAAPAVVGAPPEWFIQAAEAEFEFAESEEQLLATEV
jgi:hypothetical protein